MRWSAPRRRWRRTVRPSWSADASAGRVLRWLLRATIWAPDPQSASAHLSFVRAGQRAGGDGGLAGRPAGRARCAQAALARRGPRTLGRPRGVAGHPRRPGLGRAAARRRRRHPPGLRLRTAPGARARPRAADAARPCWSPCPPGYALRLADDAVDAVAVRRAGQRRTPPARPTRARLGSRRRPSPGDAERRCSPSSTRRWRCGAASPTSTSARRRPRSPSAPASTSCGWWPSRTGPRSAWPSASTARSPLSSRR